MAKKTAPLLPTTEALLRQFGDRLRLARLRRQLSAKQVAERAGMTPMTLRSLERGGAGVTIGAYLAVMQVLGIEKDLDVLGKADPIGRELQDARLPERQMGKALGALPVAQIRKELGALPDGVIRNILRVLPDAQLRKAFGASPETQAQLRKAFGASPATQTQLRKALAAISEPPREAMDLLDAAREAVVKFRKRAEDAQDWIKEGDFASSEALADLISPLASVKKKGR